jgi:hypothetical protein
MATELQGSAEELYRQSDVLTGVVLKFNNGFNGASGGAENSAKQFTPDPSVIRMNGHHHAVN